MKNIQFYLFLPFILFSSCIKDDKTPHNSTLQSQIETQSDLTPFEELVACAAGGQVDFLENEEFPISVFFYPELNASNFKYYETENSNADPNNLNLFLEKEVSGEALFHGFLRRFILPAPDKDVWARVSFSANDTLWYCKPVRLKYFENPTLFAPDSCSVDLSIPLEPIFNWEDEMPNENIIYFQVISDEEGNALSGTYTTDSFFQYYNLDNVVFNVTRTGQATPLLFEEKYHFTLMGVSDDNWVNFISEKEFDAQ